MPRPGALERGSRSARRQCEPLSIQKQCSRAELACGLLVDARCPSRATYYVTRRQERAALSLLGLCRAGHRGRNGSRARLDRYAPSSGNVMGAPEVTLGAKSGPPSFLPRRPRSDVDHQRGKQFVETEVSQRFGEASPRDGRAIAAARSKEATLANLGTHFALGVSASLPP